MRILMLGRGKTGGLVAEIARKHGHEVTALGSEQNRAACALTLEHLASFDVVIDFTTPEAAFDNLRASLSAGARVIIGTTGWYAHLAELTAVAGANRASLLYGTNFSVGVQAFFRAARELAHALPSASFHIREAHHITKKDAPSGTALTLQGYVAQAAHQELAHVPVTSIREGDTAGLHVLELRTGDDTLTLSHEASSRQGFAEGAVCAAEWLVRQAEPGVWDFADIAPHIR